MALSIAGAFETYLQRSDIAESTVEVKRRALQYFLEWFGDMEVGSFTSNIAEEYKVLLGKGRSSGAANTYLRVFAPFGRWLWARGLVAANPFHGVRELKEPVTKRVTFQPIELARIARIADVRWRVLVGLGLCGLRRGEALNLVVRDLDFAERHILLSSKPATAQTWSWKIKNYRERFVPLPESIELPAVTIYLHRDLMELTERLPEPQPYVCLLPAEYQADIKRITAGRWTHAHAKDPLGNFARSWLALQRRAGIAEPKRYHELRAAFVTAMIASQGLVGASKLAGHSSVQTTAGYDRKSELQNVGQSTDRLAKCYVS